MQVEITSGVHLLLSAYALSNEFEEICCVLLGTKSTLIRVSSVVFTIRKQKKKDRVEISSEQLSMALDEADRQGLQVVGWMHSHPKITVQPSHVDLKTQLSFQQLDPTFIGIIYSCFHETQTLSQRMQILCFQTLNAEELKVPFRIVPSTSSEQHAVMKLSDLFSTYLKEALNEHPRDPVCVSAVCTNLAQIQRNLVLPLLHHLK
jgi:BRCA1/BRCA2-containing complex subunit 3